MSETVLDRLPYRARVAVIRLRSLGDSVLSTPALHLLKRARPDLEIAAVSDPRFRAVYEGNEDVSEIFTPSVRLLRSFGPKLCLNLHGGTTSARLTLGSGARWRAGFEHFRFPALYNVRIPRAQVVLEEERVVHTAEHAASAMFYLGVPRSPVPRARLFATEASVPVKAPGPYAVLHASASDSAKTWPAPFFSSIAQYVKREVGLQPVFVAGPGEDVSCFQMWPVLAGAPLPHLKSLLAASTLFIGNDSGPAHMAAAFGLPVVVIYGPSDSQIWAPWRTQAEVLQANPIHEVSREQVMRALDRMRVHA